jgi:hypothetical protein
MALASSHRACRLGGSPKCQRPAAFSSSRRPACRVVAAAAHKVAVLPGDGIGPEIMKAALKVLTAAGKAEGQEFEFREALIGGAAIDATGSPLPAETLDVCKSCDSVLLAAIGGCAAWLSCQWWWWWWWCQLLRVDERGARQAAGRKAGAARVRIPPPPRGGRRHRSTRCISSTTCVAAHSRCARTARRYKWDTLPAEQRPERGLLGLRAGLNAFANLRPAIVPRQVCLRMRARVCVCLCLCVSVCVCVCRTADGVWRLGRVVSPPPLAHTHSMSHATQATNTPQARRGSVHHKHATTQPRTPPPPHTHTRARTTNHTPAAG